MNAAQRQQLAGLRHRVGLDAAKRMVAEMERIDARPPLRQTYSHTRAKAVWWGELIGACVLIALFLAVAFVVS